MKSLSTRLALGLALCVSSFSSAPAAAQCGTWSDGFAAPTPPGIDSVDRALIAGYDGGNGLELYAAARSASTTCAVWRWDGARWNVAFSTFAPANYQVSLLKTVAGPNGPQLIFSILAPTPAQGTLLFRLEGTTWTTLAPANFWALDVAGYNRGSGVEFYAAGHDSLLQGVVQRLLGVSWVPAGYVGGPIYALTAFDDGSGAKLYAGGNDVQRWAGTTWSVFGPHPGGGGTTLRFAVFNGNLYAGCFSNGLWTWNGASWSPLGSFSSVVALALADLGAGPRLAVGGTSNVALYDGASFTAPALGVGGGSVRRVAAAGSGATRALYVSGSFTSAGPIACKGLARTDGGAWDTLGRGLDSTVNALVGFDAGNGVELHAGGAFTSAGIDGALASLARWDGAQWTNVGAGPAVTVETNAFLVGDFGSGTQLHLGGRSVLGNAALGVARWNPVSGWTAFTSPVGGTVYALARYVGSSGAELVAGGAFVTPTGVSNHVAAWNGASWDPLGGGTDGDVRALAVYDSGSGPLLYAGGSFANAGAVGAGRIASWDGTAWAAVGGGITGGTINGLAVFALCVFDDGTGAQLYAGGVFTSAGVAGTGCLARWNGASWSAVPGWSGVNVQGNSFGPVYALHVHDDGRGPALYAGGAIGNPAKHLVRYDGAGWEVVDSNLEGSVRALASVDDDGDGDPELFVGGDFTAVQPVAAGRIARLEGCPTYATFCSGDGSSADHTSVCPCGNVGAPGRGCANSANPNGALLTPSGSPALDTVVLEVIDTPANALGIYLQHDARDDRVFHDGVSCAGGNLIRLRNRNASGGASAFPDSTFAQDATVTLSQRGLVAPGSGLTRYYSTFYRNASTTFCPPATANVTNGVRVTW